MEVERLNSSERIPENSKDHPQDKADIVTFTVTGGPFLDRLLNAILLRRPTEKVTVRLATVTKVVIKGTGGTFRIVRKTVVKGTKELFGRLRRHQ